jgi:Fe-S oxidoreductase
MECGRCEEVCPAFVSGKPLSPKRVVQDLKSVMEKLAAIGDRSRAASAAAGTPTRESSLDVHAIVAPETLWSCTACSACVWACPVRIDQVTMILDLRRHLVADGGLSGTAATALRRMQSSANPWGLPAGERAHWIENLNPASPNPPANS